MSYNSGKEISFDQDKIIVSKTDLLGKITYGNELFIELSGYSEEELLGAPHNIIRHPKMPMIVFKLLWEYVAEGKEIFAYVVNLTKCGNYYWVLANVTPSFDKEGKIIGYHSVRRKPKAETIKKIEEIYSLLSDIESREGMDGSRKKLEEVLKTEGKSYEEYILSI